MIDALYNKSVDSLHPRICRRTASSSPALFFFSSLEGPSKQPRSPTYILFPQNHFHRGAKGLVLPWLSHSPHRSVMASDRQGFLRPPTSGRSPGGSSSSPQSSLLRRLDRQLSHENSPQLPNLPRFHPANFPSSQSSLAVAPSSSINSPQPPMSPRSQQRQISEAQKQLYAYQREVLSRPVSWQSTLIKPASPRLAPCASPGAVTPLELEGENYLVAGSTSPNKMQPDYVDKLIREEAARLGDIQPRPPPSVEPC